MAVMHRFAFFSLLLLPYQCEAKAENDSETQSLLLPIQETIELHLNFVSRLPRKVYINLVNGSLLKQFLLDKILASLLLVWMIS